jgi:hypothetical protein
MQPPLNNEKGRMQQVQIGDKSGVHGSLTIFLLQQSYKNIAFLHLF